MSEKGRNSFSASQVRSLIFNVGIWLMVLDIERFLLVFNFFSRMSLQGLVCLFLLLPSLKAMTDANMKWAVFSCCNGIWSYFCVGVVHWFSIWLYTNSCTAQPYWGRAVPPTDTAHTWGTWGPILHSSLIITHADPASEVICCYNKTDTLLMFLLFYYLKYDYDVEK